MRTTEILKARGHELMQAPAQFNAFVQVSTEQDQEVNQFLNDLESHPHIFVLACLMDQQIRAERAWRIPYQVGQAIGNLSFSAFRALNLDTLTQIFHSNGLHRFNDKMADVFYRALQRIEIEYGGHAANIWLDQPSSARVVLRFLGFHGAGIKIATMATNILARDFKIEMSDHTSIDISPDVHVMRVFKRLGYIHLDANELELIYTAREMNPIYPGILDFSVWEIGTQWCRETQPRCGQCYLSEHCPKIGVPQA
jgi:endonuclease III